MALRDAAVAARALARRSLEKTLTRVGSGRVPRCELLA